MFIFDRCHSSLSGEIKDVLALLHVVVSKTCVKIGL
jgi:hypothetical protein